MTYDELKHLIYMNESDDSTVRLSKDDIDRLAKVANMAPAAKVLETIKIPSEMKADYRKGLKAYEESRPNLIPYPKLKSHIYPLNSLNGLINKEKRINKLSKFLQYPNANGTIYCDPSDKELFALINFSRTTRNGGVTVNMKEKSFLLLDSSISRTDEAYYLAALKLDRRAVSWIIGYGKKNTDERDAIKKDEIGANRIARVETNYKPSR